MSAVVAGLATAQDTAATYAPGLQVDVYRPQEAATQPRPAVLLIHGGGWTSLDKSTMRGMGKFFARNGFVAFAVDYRLFDGKTNRWPTQLDDVERAVRWIRENAARYGVDPNKIGAFGHSAGAQLAALLGMEGTPDSSRVQAVVDVSGPSDFRSERDSGTRAFLTSFVGSEAAWRDASPVAHAKKGDAPFLVVHGTQDTGVPIAQAQELVDTLQAAGVPVSFIKIEDGHTFRDYGRRQLAIETLAFFHRYLVGDK